MARDYQRRRVFAAEQVARDKLGDRLATLDRDQIRSLVIKACREEKVDCCRVEFLDRDVRADYSYGHVRVPRSSMRADFVVHQLAHHVVHHRFPDHGIEWVQAYLRMLRSYVGDEVADAFRDAFDDGGVHRDPLTRVKRVRRIAVNLANKGGGNVHLVLDYDGEARWVNGFLSQADANMLVIDDTVYPMRWARYIEVVPQSTENP